MPKYPVCGNAPALPAASFMSRRSLLTALPAAGVALALPDVAQTAEPDPVVPLYHEWLDARREWRRIMDLTPDCRQNDPRMLVEEDREVEAEDRMMLLTPTTLAGISAMVSVAWSYEGPCSTDPEKYAADAKSAHSQALLAIWRACTGKDGYPET